MMTDAQVRLLRQKREDAGNGRSRGRHEHPVGAQMGEWVTAVGDQATPVWPLAHTHVIPSGTYHPTLFTDPGLKKGDVPRGSA
jgi:hypothetical protein